MLSNVAGGLDRGFARTASYFSSQKFSRFSYSCNIRRAFKVAPFKLSSSSPYFIHPKPKQFLEYLVSKQLFFPQRDHVSHNFTKQRSNLFLYILIYNNAFETAWSDACIRS